MKQRLLRPTAALFPVAGIIGALLGSGTEIFGIYVSYYLLQLLSLCAADCFRNAAAQEPGIRRVDRRFSGAFVQLIIGIILTWTVSQFVLSAHLEIANWKGAIIAAALINIEHMFEERMYALGRRVDGVMLSCITNGLLLVGLVLNRGMAYAIVGAGLGALISAITAYAIEPAHGFSLKPANLSFAASATPQTLLYVIAVVAALALTGMKIEEIPAPLLFGLIPWRLARTTCRRTQDESRPLNLLLTACAAIPAAIAAWLPAVTPYAITASIALLCGAVVFCAPSKRLYAGIVFISAALIPFPTPLINAALSLAAIGINMKQAFLKKV